MTTIEIGSKEQPGDLATAAFVALAETFFESDAQPTPFSLRDKRNTQDDPLDVHIKDVLEKRLPSPFRVLSSGKPLVSPDLIVARPEETRALLAGETEPDGNRMIAIEVKKLGWSAGGPARATGLDYNSTPPSSMVKVEAANGTTLWVPSYYLFVIVRSQTDLMSTIQTLVLVTGAALNDDLTLYERATGVRQKSIGLGTYADGIDRERPMFVFANPLGWRWLGNSATLIHSRADLESEQRVVRVRKMERSAVDDTRRSFWCYRTLPLGHGDDCTDALDPFPMPLKRTTETTRRGRFKINL
jgi:hypothetical protein